MKYILKKIKNFFLMLWEWAGSYPVAVAVLFSITGVVVSWCLFAGDCL